MTKIIAATLLCAVYCAICFGFWLYPGITLICLGLFALWIVYRDSVLWAEVWCFFHCLAPWNILRGHCRYIERDSKGRTLVIAAVTGSIHRDTIHYEKVFYGGPVDPTQQLANFFQCYNQDTRSFALPG